MKPLAITGAGVTSAFGVGWDAFAEGIRTAFSSRGARARGATPRGLEVPGFDAAKHLGDKGLRSLDRLTKLLVVATRLGLHEAGFKRDGAWVARGPEAVGIVVSNAYGSLEAITELDRVALLEDARYINPSRFPLTVSNSAAGYASIWEDLRALNVTVSDGNCGGLDAMACAQVFLQEGRAAALLVGGAEASSEALSLGFERLGALSDRARLGEGSALLAVELPDAARERGASIGGTVEGFGTAFEAPARGSALVHASPRAVERAIAAALADAATPAREIDVVVCGASGLAAFDQAELAGIRRALGDDVCVIAPKFILGETLGAGGALAMSACLALFSGGAGLSRGAGGGRGSFAADADAHADADAYADADADADADAERSPRAGWNGPAPVLRGGLRAGARTALVTSLGYYGNASALVMRAPAR